ncbi:4-alpha-glucanotransferase [Rhodoplanes sp. TEM]|uniref:4-alpha-glucanotransferase n=1 Tax=Rhodoplanes tepidamans TaxID=200616 RepID=A0ABT5JAV6_RHOTP|nr:MULTISPECIES: 4-alpha-glucanotransferase [Rhodoplanes]MDC7786573.1 4-alpha-glucanotransferase [Rhodoplanes tepidamans]MDC7983089.1 4-alpha-glucanotransferase [Rhodoplanes sp. TEM]MDQ0357546.1 4-alpha-glucanotransferase [Rhodoplanes tepidamans]
MSEGELSRRAETFGVETSYYDARGTLREVGDDAVGAILDVLARSGPPPGAEPHVHVRRRGRIEPIYGVCGDGTAWKLTRGNRTVASGTCEHGAVVLPEKTKVGSYRLLLDPAGERPQAVLVAPEAAWQPKTFDKGGRVWALAVQLYGVRSEHNWGIGDFSDLRSLVRIAGSFGAAGVALNPLHAITLDDPGAISPYSPTSRLFLNPLYVDVAAIPEFPGLAAAGLADEVARLRSTAQVDYAGVIPAKLKALRLAFEAFRERGSAERHADFAAFKSERGDWLTGFCAFAVLRARYGGPWWMWPEEWRAPSRDTLTRLAASDAAEMEFHAFVQWTADRQLAACSTAAAEAGMPVGLYLDVAVGVAADSADVWSNQGAYVRELSAGAPPDLLNTAGQDWGLASFNPRVLMETDFALLRETLRAVMRHAGAIRLDHVLGFNRLYMVPHGFKADQGTYVRFPLEAMLAVVAQESQAEHCLVIGEDLGTVPDGFRETLAGWNVWSYRIMLFERAWDSDSSFSPPHGYPEQALVSFSTHDLSTFSGWMSGHDLDVKHGLGIDPGETEDARQHARQMIAAALRHEVGADHVSFDGVARFLARTPARLLVVAAEDAFQVADQPNVPGTINQHPNWRQTLPVRLEDFSSDHRLVEIARILREEGRAFG